MFVKNGALKHLKGEDGFLHLKGEDGFFGWDFKQFFFLVVFLVLFTWLSLHDYFIRSFFKVFGVTYP
jgi:hypothetical protein